MSEATLTVPTAFVDISQLAEGLADRVDEGRLMLYGPEPVEDGAWVRFAVLLEDQSPALEGVGRAVTSIDGGEERPEVARWDIVLDNLQLEGTGEVVYERILMVRGGAFEGAPATGEVSLDEVEQIEEAAAPEPGATEAQAQPGDEFVDESTAVAEPGDYQEQIAASAHEAQQAETAAGAESYGADEYAQPTDYGQPAGADEVVDDEATMVAEAPEEMLDAAQAAPEEPAAAEAGFQDPGVAADAEQAYGEQPAHDEQAAYGEQAAYDEQAWGQEPAAEAEPAYQEPAYQEAAYGEEAGWGEEQPAYGEEPAYQEAAYGEQAEDVGTADVDMGDVEDITSLPPSAPAPSMPEAPQGFQIQAVGVDGRVLSRPSLEASWYPQAAPPPEPQPSSGLFAYAGGIPIPGAAPRPDLDPSLRIQPAPRPAPGASASQPAPAPEADVDVGDWGGEAPDAPAEPSDASDYDASGYDASDYDASGYDAGPDVTSPEVTSPDQPMPETLEADIDVLEGPGGETVDAGDAERVDPGAEPEDYRAEADAGDVAAEVEIPDEPAVDVDASEEGDEDERQ